MTTSQQTPKQSWNRGRIVGPEPPLKPKHIWATRTRLVHNGHVRDLAISTSRSSQAARLRSDLATR